MAHRPAIVLALLAAGSVAAVARAGPGPSDAEYHKLCRAIRPVHVAPLFRGPVAPMKLGGSSDCAFFPRGGDALADGVRVFLRIDDGDQMLWQHRGDRPYGRFRALRPGAGSRAKWGYQGGRLPSVVDARTGSFTCTVIPTSGGTGLAPQQGTPLEAATRYAQLLVRLCADVFAAYR